jgi:mRNA-degrading endonuclease RelE of RelBE toxin-antitoxin system
MAKYTVFISKSVQKQLAKLPEKYAEALEDKMLELENNPRPQGVKN